MLLTLHLDLFTASLLGVSITALSTGLFGGTLLQHILKARRRPT
jgi:hypothetical protein